MIPAAIIGRREGKPRSEYFVWRGRWHATHSVSKVRPEKVVRKTRKGNGNLKDISTTSRPLEQARKLHSPNRLIVKLRAPILIGYDPVTTNSNSTDLILVNTFAGSEKSIAQRRKLETSHCLEYGNIKSEQEDEGCHNGHQTPTESDTL